MAKETAKMAGIGGLQGIGGAYRRDFETKDDEVTPESMLGSIVEGAKGGAEMGFVSRGAKYGLGALGKLGAKGLSKAAEAVESQIANEPEIKNPLKIEDKYAPTKAVFDPNSDNVLVSKKSSDFLAETNKARQRDAALTNATQAVDVRNHGAEVTSGFDDIATSLEADMTSMDSLFDYMGKERKENGKTVVPA